MTEVASLRPKTYAYLLDDGSDHKKAKDTKKCVIKQKLMFENYKDCLFNNKTVYRSQERFKSYYHDVSIEEVNLPYKTTKFLCFSLKKNKKAILSKFK